MTTVYHGSSRIVKLPEYRHKDSKPYNDYGLGFYMTHDRDLAGEWATLATGKDGFVSEYLLNTDGLNSLFLDREDIKHWIAVLMHHRRGNYEEELHDIIGIFCSKYLIDVKEYDIVLGWRADDSYFAFVEDFALGLLSLENLQKAMRFGDLGQQVCLKSRHAFDCIEYVAYHMAPAVDFYQTAKNRDNAAREAYRRLRKESNAREGTLITDLL